MNLNKGKRAALILINHVKTSAGSKLFSFAKCLMFNEFVVKLIKAERQYLALIVQQQVFWIQHPDRWECEWWDNGLELALQLKSAL